MHDYVLVYRMSALWQPGLLVHGTEKDKQYKFEDGREVFRCSDYTCGKTAEERPNLFCAFKQPNTGEDIWPKRTRVWVYSQEEHQ